MAWEDHYELVSAPGDGYDPRTDWRYNDDIDREVSTEMGEMADEYVDWMSDPGRAISVGARMAAAQRRNPRRPILPLGVALAAMTPALAGAERFGSEPPIGTVLRWQAEGRVGRGVGQMLTYLAIRTPNGWWTTRDGRNGSTPWAEIVTLIADNPCSVATAWTEIPAPEPEPQGDDVVAAWASQFRAAAPVTRHLGPESPEPEIDADEPPEPRFDPVTGKDRNGWTRAELGLED